MALPVSQPNRNNTHSASVVGAFGIAGVLGGRMVVKQANREIASWNEANRILSAMTITNKERIVQFIEIPMVYNPDTNGWERQPSCVPSGLGWTKIVRDGRTYEVQPGSIQDVLSAVVNKRSFGTIAGVGEVFGTKAEVDVKTLPPGSYVCRNDKVYALEFGDAPYKLVKSSQRGCFNVTENDRPIPGIQVRNWTGEPGGEDAYAMELKRGEPSGLTRTIHDHPHAVKALTTLVSVISGFAATSWLFPRRT